MRIAFGRALVVASIVLAVGCGGSSSTTATPEALCQGICSNEAKLACPNGDETGCNTGCQALLAQDKQEFPSCVDQINAVFACTGKVATTSIHCSATNPSPDYDPGFCPTESAAFTACMGTCNAIANTATTIDVTQVAEALPAASAAGGPFAPGTYFRTSTTIYTGVGGATGPNGDTDQQTLVVSAASSGAGAIILQSVYSSNGAPDQNVTLMGTPSGTTLSVVVTCPGSSSLGDSPYTATATGFTLYDTTKIAVDVYTKQ